jgi:hypothetical protein
VARSDEDVVTSRRKNFTFLARDLSRGRGNLVEGAAWLFSGSC